MQYITLVLRIREQSLSHVGAILPVPFWRVGVAALNPHGSDEAWVSCWVATRVISHLRSTHWSVSFLPARSRDLLPRPKTDAKAESCHFSTFTSSLLYISIARQDVLYGDVLQR
jgi:hypothetical protein